MSMPDITLEVIDPRIALASIVGSIALQEAAVSHVLNAEGEKIQAVVGMTGVSVTDLQSINLTVGETISNVALFSDDLQNKLRTALQALFPLAELSIYFVESTTGAPVNCQCVECILTNDATGDTSVFFARRDTLTIPNLKPGSYTLRMIDACLGYTPNMNAFDIEVDSKGNVAFNGFAVTPQSPAEIDLTAGPSGAAQAADAQNQALVQNQASVQNAVLSKETSQATASETLQKPGVKQEVTQYFVSKLTNDVTGESAIYYPQGDTLTLPNLKPGNYTLTVTDVYGGYTRSESENRIHVDASGSATFNDAAVTAESPATVELAGRVIGINLSIEKA